MKGLQDIISGLPLFKGIAPEYIELMAGCASNVRFGQGDFLFHEGDPADNFYLIRHGRVALDIFVPQRGPVTFETIHEGGVIGWSWLFPPYRRHSDARAIVLTRAVAFDGECLRAKCEEDKALGYEFLKRFGQVMVDRIRATRLQLLDVYGDSSSA